MNKQMKGAYSKSIFDTLMQAYRPFFLKICATIIFGFLGRFLILSNIQVTGQYIDQQPVLTIQNLQPLFYKLLILLSIAFTLTLFFRTVFSRLSALAVSRIYDETTYRV